jgi:hypothetical protein
MSELPQETQQTYDELATGATTPEETAALREMHEQDAAERAQAIKDIVDAPLPEVSPSGVVAASPEEAEELHQPGSEYGQGGARS